MEAGTNPSQHAAPSTPSEVLPSKIFHPQAIGAATFLGGPIPGGIALLVNESKMGNVGLGVGLLVLSVAVMAALFGASLTFDLAMSVQGINLAVVAVVTLAADKRYGAVIEQQKAAGVKNYGTLVGAALGLAFLLVWLGSLAASYRLGPFAEEKIQLESGSTVFLRGEATEGDARDVGALFGELGLFVGGDYFIDRREGRLKVGVIVLDAWFEDPNAERNGIHIANLLSSLLVDGSPTTFAAVDATNRWWAAPRFEDLTTYDSDGTLGVGYRWGTQSILFVRDGQDGAVVEVLASLEGGELADLQGLILGIHEGAGGRRGCVMVTPDMLTRPNIDATVQVTASLIPGLAGVDVCDHFGHILRAASP